jgi:D-cysteine desulfhydrase family pyridoxal phosphate-dependent enzyme
MNELPINSTKDHITKKLLSLPKASLGFFPTPLHKLENISKDLGVNLFIKRDDFSGRNLFGGNKIRKLEYLLGKAKQQGCEYVVTYGATQSNHAMQTVAACRTLGLKPSLYLVAIVPVNEEDLRSNLLLDQLFGAEIHIVTPMAGESEERAEERSFELGKARQAELEATGHKCFDIPLGGANFLGSTAFMEGFVEMTDQMTALNLHADYLFHATGTGGTLAGLIAGKKAINETTKIISINVSAKDNSYLVKVADLANEALEHLNLTTRVDPFADLCMDLNYYAPGYEQPNQASTEAIKYLAQMEGLLIDPVYTGKAFAGLLDYIRSGKIPCESNVVFWHTGGATALFAEKEILGKI